MYYGVHTTCFAFLFERTFLVIHCKTHLWSLLLTFIGSWTAPSLWSRYNISLRYISYFYPSFVLFISCSFWCLLLAQIFGWCFYKFLQLLLWFQQSAYQVILFKFFFFFLMSHSYLYIICFVFYFWCNYCLPTFIDPFCLELSPAFSLTFQLAVLHSVIIMML